jgi:hypothetical protein
LLPEPLVWLVFQKSLHMSIQKNISPFFSRKFTILTLMLGLSSMLI